MTAAILYNPEGYSTSGERLMGRHAAGESFLRAFCSGSGREEFWIYVEDQGHAHEFASVTKEIGASLPIKAITRETIESLSDPGVLFVPGPGIDSFAYQRHIQPGGRWSLCGITHTTASAVVMDSISNLLIAPLNESDALICTSQAVRKNVETIMASQSQYLVQRLGACETTLPQLPVIPLGIHTDDFNFNETDRDVARQSMAIADDEIAVLYLGRLAFHAKAHPLAMYQALQVAGSKTEKKVVLIECGWYPNAPIGDAFKQAAAYACPGVRRLSLDGRVGSNRKLAWAAADIFCSFSDNIQETFGITPVEAMAAGLPTVVSDWDGYKETVRHGIDGFRVPTLMAAPGMGEDLASRYALEVDSYDRYCGNVSSLVALDIDAASTAFSNLFESEDLRRRMGRSGRARALQKFDWKQILPQYDALWAEQRKIRQFNMKTASSSPGAWPARLDPFNGFKHYPTNVIQQNTVLALIDPSPILALDRIQELLKLSMVNFANQIQLTPGELEMVLTKAATPLTVEELTGGVSQGRKKYVSRSLVWLIKIGILRVQE